MKRINILLIAALAMSCVSCKKYLDIVPDDVATLDNAFDNRNDALNYLYTCYSYMQQREPFYLNPGATSSGELIDNPPGDFYFGDAGFASNWQYLRGVQTVDAPIQDYFAALYQAIRKCNTFLENINKPVDLTEAEKERWIGEAEFLKAYYYFLLVRQYGPVPLVKENAPVNTPTDEAKMPRDPSDSVFSYIVQQLDSAAVVLPPNISQVIEYGRATSIMSLALKAKVLITQASPLFNGDAAEASLKGPGGEQLFPATSDPDKWKVALQACKDAINATKDNGISLYHSNPASIVPNAIRLQFSIQDPITGPQSSQMPEQIWPGNWNMSFTQMTMAPKISRVSTSGISDPSNQLAVPLAVAELFYSNNGVPIDEDKTYDYSGRYSLVTAPDNYDSRYYVKPGYTTVKLHINREPRFYADLSFDGGIWYGNGTTDTTNLLYQNSLFPANNNVTGYWPKKLVSYQTVLTGVTTVYASYYEPLMRLSDLYLLYAEASNEVNGPAQDAYMYLDSVRARAGLQGTVQSWSQFSNNPNKPLTQAGLRSIIHQERRIELCFEGEIGWDLRRWKEYVSMFSSSSVKGWNGLVGADTPEEYYHLYQVFLPYMSAKDYFWPINTGTLLNNSKLVQNIGW